MSTSQSTKGFTLIELLVVIAIIGLLASVVLASLAQARNSARDAAIAQQVAELGKLFELQYLQTKNYSGLSTSVNNVGTAAACPNLFVSTSQYYDQAIQICGAIVTNQIASGVGGYLIARGNSGINKNGVQVPLGSAFSILARSATPDDPATAEYHCLGSSGGRSKSPTALPGPSTWMAPGCINNP